MSSGEPHDPAPVFAALGDATRLALIWRLRDGKSLSISQLTDGLDLTRQGVSKHLGVLERAGLVTHERIGRESRYVYRPKPVEQARDYLDAVSQQWDAAIDRLKDHLGA